MTICGRLRSAGWRRRRRPGRQVRRDRFEGRFREVSPPERLVQTFEWDGLPAYVAVDTTTLEDLGDGRTRVVTTSLFQTAEERDGMLNSGMEGGLSQSYVALDAVLASLN